jgi:hypothetical protein
MRYLIGVDDTDSLDSRGTGNLVRPLAEWLQTDRLAEPHGITRHQLLVDSDIPCTSHNSSACMSIDTENVEAVWETARDFLVLESAAGSDVGLCLGRWDTISQEVVAFGRRAKAEVLTLQEAEQAASKSHIRVAGLKGNGGGIIGALAAIGLHRDGNDGRFLWLPGLRELQGTYSVAQIYDKAQIDRVCSLDGAELSVDALVNVGQGVSPLLRGGLATLFVEEKKHGWYALDRDRVKSLSK